MWLVSLLLGGMLLNGVPLAEKWFHTLGAPLGVGINLERVHEATQSQVSCSMAGLSTSRGMVLKVIPFAEKWLQTIGVLQYASL